MEGMKDCCVQPVPQSDLDSYETFAGPMVEWQARLTAGLEQSIRASDQTLGDMEEQILHQTQGLERKLLEEAAQKKARQKRHAQLPGVRP